MKVHVLLLAVLLAATAAAAQVPSNPASPLPVRSVTLFTSGVGYTERGGEVTGDATVPLTFRTAQINDILKSMVLLDSNGQVQPATYAARDPIGRTLRSFAIDVTENATEDQILSRLRGATVTVDTTARGAITGQIVGVESRHVAGEDTKPVIAPFVTLLGENGLTTIRLDTVKSIKLLDERLNREFKEALGLLASGSDDQRRQVTLHFSGNGRRQVRVGYVMEAPLWKMSYRLVMGDQKAAQAAPKPYLQGWALVENTSDEDWKDVRLTLVSGRPVSFIQDLYQPLYIPRPVVAPDVIASPFPQTHSGDLLDKDRKVAAAQPADAASMAERRSGGAGGFGGGGLGGGGFGPLGGPRGEKGDARKSESVLGYDLDNSIIVAGTDEAIREMKKRIVAEASGGSLGELFQYNITKPVNLPRQQASMIPVISQDIDADKLSIYNADLGSKFPMNAVRLKNNTTLHLKGGPITLFDGGSYAGDAKMEDIPPGDNRLVSYAVDLSIEGERQGPNASIYETSLTLKRGVLTATRREQQVVNYTLKSKANKPRVVLVEHPFNSEYKLIEPAKPTERTAQLYRFAVTVPAGKSETLKVVTERPISQEVRVMDADLNVLAFYANRKDISAKLKETLQDVVQRRRKVQELQTQASLKDVEIKTMGDDQDRIRKNMQALDRTSALYIRYVTELDNQETRMQTLRQEAVSLRKQASDAERELRAFLDGLTIGE